LDSINKKQAHFVNLKSVFRTGSLRDTFAKRAISTDISYSVDARNMDKEGVIMGRFYAPHFSKLNMFLKISRASGRQRCQREFACYVQALSERGRFACR